MKTKLVESTFLAGHLGSLVPSSIGPSPWDRELSVGTPSLKATAKGPLFLLDRLSDVLFRRFDRLFGGGELPLGRLDDLYGRPSRSRAPRPRPRPRPGRRDRVSNGVDPVENLRDRRAARRTALRAASVRSVRRPATRKMAIPT